MKESGISTYFAQNKVRIRYKTMEELGFPDHIHLRINEEKKHLFIEKCSHDIDSFRIRYQKVMDGSDKERQRVDNRSCYINAKPFLRYLAQVIGVPCDSPSFRFSGKLLPDGSYFVDLNQYEVIPPKKTKHSSEVTNQPEENHNESGM